MTNETNAALVRAIEWAGGRDGLARLCNVSLHSVLRWERLGRVPAVPARLISLAMQEEVSADALCAREPQPKDE